MGFAGKQNTSRGKAVFILQTLASLNIDPASDNYRVPPAQSQGVFRNWKQHLLIVSSGLLSGWAWAFPQLLLRLRQRREEEEEEEEASVTWGPGDERCWGGQACRQALWCEGVWLRSVCVKPVFPCGIPAPQLVWESGGLCGPLRGPELPPVGKACPSAVPFCHHSPDMLLSLQAWLEPSERGRGFPESFASGILCAT